MKVEHASNRSSENNVIADVPIIFFIFGFSEVHFDQHRPKSEVTGVEHAESATEGWHGNVMQSGSSR
ncbi:hypothetical protein [Ruegeria arenilitoris]|uniref:hypothetical protein n=1 Tax=Ruegeria arenilitoris TaxID=1173585 RepID=UPI00147EAF6A|nr:hypothetical protein [Ruegeria arenilitoris]